MNSTDNELQAAIELIRDGHWDEAHEIVQVRDDQFSCWIHGWLHRQEGDNGNARYWYNLAGQSFLDNSLEEELDRIAKALAAQ